MSVNGWGRRIERAEELAGQYPFAAEILHFYAHIARFQQSLRDRMELASSARSDATGRTLTGPPELAGMMASFPKFLSVVERNGPARLAETAEQLCAQPENSWTQLLNDFWDEPGTANSPASAESFFARAFLQPYAEFARLRSEMKWDGYTRTVCPFCGRKPGLGVLRQQGDGGQRSLVCSFCLAEWEFRRIVCVGCGEQDHKKLPVYTAADLEHIRVECCDSCKLYIKTVDLTKNGLAEPVVDELAAVPLDLWAQERGYLKLQANLMQL
jgi:FdhE protein